MSLRTKSGHVVPHGFDCGYVDDSFGHGTRIEKRYDAELRYRVYLARADGGHSVLYKGGNLTGARNACRRYGRLLRKYAHAPYVMESQGVGESYVARVRLYGVILAVGSTVSEAMENAATAERAQ